MTFHGSKFFLLFFNDLRLNSMLLSTKNLIVPSKK